MFLIFPLLILSISILLLYFSYKLKTTEKIDNLTAELSKVNEEKTMIEVKYNKVLSDVKKQEDLKKSKSLDEMQLLFTKVNMLDDKITFFNTNFKSQLEIIASLLENNISMVQSIVSTPLVDVKERMSDEFQEFEEEQNGTVEDLPLDVQEANAEAESVMDNAEVVESNETVEEPAVLEEEVVVNDKPAVLKEPLENPASIDQDTAVLDQDQTVDIDEVSAPVEVSEESVTKEEEIVATPTANVSTPTDTVAPNNNATTPANNPVAPSNSVNTPVNNTVNVNTPSAPTNTPKPNEEMAAAQVQNEEILTPLPQKDAAANDIEPETVIEEKDIAIKPVKADDDILVDNELPNIDDLEIESNIDSSEMDTLAMQDSNESQTDAEVIAKTVAVENQPTPKPQPASLDNSDLSLDDDDEMLFDNSTSLDVDILGENFGDDNEEIANDTKAMDIAMSGGDSNIADDLEINSALKELDNINFDLSEEIDGQKTNSNIAPQNNTGNVSNFDSDTIDLDEDLEDLKKVVKNANMQNVESQPKSTSGIDLGVSTTEDDEDDNSIDEDFLNSNPLIDDSSDDGMSFDIKESIERLKAQLDNKDDKQE